MSVVFDKTTTNFEQNAAFYQSTRFEKTEAIFKNWELITTTEINPGKKLKAMEAEFMKRHVNFKGFVNLTKVVPNNGTLKGKPLYCIDDLAFLYETTSRDLEKQTFSFFEYEVTYAKDGKPEKNIIGLIAKWKTETFLDANEDTVLRKFLPIVMLPKTVAAALLFSSSSKTTDGDTKTKADELQILQEQLQKILGSSFTHICGITEQDDKIRFGIHGSSQTKLDIMSSLEKLGATGTREKPDEMDYCPGQACVTIIKTALQRVIQTQLSSSLEASKVSASC